MESGMSQLTSSEGGKAAMEVTADPTTCRILCEEMVAKLRAAKPTRETSLAITKLQEASMWLNEVNRLS